MKRLIDGAMDESLLRAVALAGCMMAYCGVLLIVLLLAGALGQAPGTP